MLSYTKVVQGEGEGLPQRGAWERPDARACFVVPTWVSRRFSGVCRKVFPRPVELHGAWTVSPLTAVAALSLDHVPLAQSVGPSCQHRHLPPLASVTGSRDLGWLKSNDFVFLLQD